MGAGDGGQMRAEPILFGPQSVATMAKWPQHRAIKWRQVSPPTAGMVRFDVTGAGDTRRAECIQRQRLGVDARHDAVWGDDQVCGD